MIRKLTRTVLSIAVGLVIGGCGDDNPFGIEGVPENDDFAPGLGVDIGRMTLTATGMYIEDLVVGTGAVAEAGSVATVQFTGWLIDGTEFDSGAFQFQLGAGQVIPGFEEGVLGMQVGGKRRLVVPPALAYGTQGLGSVPENAYLVFDVELTALQ